MEKHVPGHQPAAILRLQIIDVCAITVNFFVNRVSGTVQEILSVARLRDRLARFFIDLPAVKNLPLSDIVSAAALIAASRPSRTTLKIF